MELAPDKTLAQNNGRIGKGNGIVCVANVDGFVAQELTISARRIEAVDGGDGKVGAFSGFTSALAEENTSVFDFLDSRTVRPRRLEA